MAERKRRHLRQSSRLYLAIPLFTLLVILVVSIVLIALYIKSNQIGYLVALVVSFGVFLVGYIVIAYFVLRRIHFVYYDQIYETTYENVKKLTNNDSNLSTYRDLDIAEIHELNEAMLELKTLFGNSLLLNKVPNYSNIPLVYVDKEKNLVTYESFKKNLKNIISVSQSFRNVIIEIHYFLPNGTLPKEEIARLLQLYMSLFNDYYDALYMVGEENKSILIYLPVIDSFSKIEETLKMSMADSSVVIRDVKGLETVNARFAIVCYPFSAEEYMLSDLRYAKRQDKILNFFLPSRTQNNYSKKALLSTSMNLNYMSKMLSRVSILDYDSIDNSKNVTAIKNLFNDIASYLALDEAGIIIYDNVETLKYRDFLCSDRSMIFKKNNNIDPSLIKAFNEACDPDHSYYFSTRSHAKRSLGKQLDYYGIYSGFYYVIKNNENISSIIYFFNRHKDFNIDTYMRET